MACDDVLKRRAFVAGLGASAVSLAAPAWAQDGGAYSEPEVISEARAFFGESAEGLATVIARVFEQNGRPVGYITGREGSGAIGVGVRYGDGRMTLHGETSTYKVYWRGPSIGFDTGGDGARVFTLIYNMTNYRQIYRRYPGVDGSAYLVGGFGVNYQRAAGITLAPIRSGVGLRLGASIGYLAYSPRRVIVPF